MILILKSNEWMIPLQERCKPNQLIGSIKWLYNIYLKRYGRSLFLKKIPKYCGIKILWCWICSTTYIRYTYIRSAQVLQKLESFLNTPYIFDLLIIILPVIPISTPFPGKQRTFPGVTGILSMCFYSYTLLACKQLD